MFNPYVIWYILMIKVVYERPCKVKHALYIFFQQKKEAACLTVY